LQDRSFVLNVNEQIQAIKWVNNLKKYAKTDRKSKKEIEDDNRILLSIFSALTKCKNIEWPNDWEDDTKWENALEEHAEFDDNLNSYPVHVLTIAFFYAQNLVEIEKRKKIMEESHRSYEERKRRDLRLVYSPPSRTPVEPAITPSSSYQAFLSRSNPLKLILRPA
jgi:hypothetical protein